MSTASSNLIEHANLRLALETERFADLMAQDRARRDAERIMAERQQAREDADQRRELQVRYADSFAAFGTQPPMPVDDESPGRYRKRLFDSLQRKLPATHELATIRSDDLSSASGQARAHFEQMLLQAAAAEGATPSAANLPRDGSMVTRVRIDPDSGAKRTEFYGRRSFIKDLNQPARRVTAFMTKAGIVRCGAEQS